MMCGRMGALIGNVVFPYLLALGCVAPFTMVGTIMLGKERWDNKMKRSLIVYFVYSEQLPVHGTAQIEHGGAEMNATIEYYMYE